MKEFANWLYKKTHHDELIQVARYVKKQVDEPYPAPRESLGALGTLTILNLLVNP